MAPAEFMSFRDGTISSFCVLVVPMLFEVGALMEFSAIYDDGARMALRAAAIATAKKSCFKLTCRS
jgi:hypothetical protein